MSVTELKPIRCVCCGGTDFYGHGDVCRRCVPDYYDQKARAEMVQRQRETELFQKREKLRECLMQQEAEEREEYRQQMRKIHYRITNQFIALDPDQPPPQAGFWWVSGIMPQINYPGYPALQLQNGYGVYPSRTEALAAWDRALLAGWTDLQAGPVWERWPGDFAEDSPLFINVDMMECP